MEGEGEGKGKGKGNLTQRRKDAEAQKTKNQSQNFIFSDPFCVFVPLVRQAKPDLARQLEGVDHVNCPFDM